MIDISLAFQFICPVGGKKWRPVLLDIQWVPMRFTREFRFFHTFRFFHRICIIPLPKTLVQEVIHHFIFICGSRLEKGAQRTA